MLLVLMMVLTSILEAHLKWLVLPLFLTLILEEDDLKLLALSLFLTLIPVDNDLMLLVLKLLFLISILEANLVLMVQLVLSKTATVLVVLNTILYSCPIRETCCLIKIRLLMSSWNLVVSIQIQSTFTGPMVDVVEANSRTSLFDLEAAYKPVALIKAVDISESAFPIQGGTVQTEVVSEASTRSWSTPRSSLRLVTSMLLTV